MKRLLLISLLSALAALLPASGHAPGSPSKEDFAELRPVPARALFQIAASTDNRIRERDWNGGDCDPGGDPPPATGDPGAGRIRAGFFNWHSGECRRHFYLYRGWLGFDLSALPKEKMPVECTLSFAAEEVVELAGPHSGLRFYALTAPWDKSPEALFAIQARPVDPADLRTLVVSWLSDPASNRGLLITGPEEGQADYPGNGDGFVAILDQPVLTVRYQ